MDIKIKPIKSVAGEIEVPGDKSISHRAVMFGAIAEGTTSADNFLTGEDCVSTADAFRKMGVSVKISGKKLCVQGAGARGLKKPEGDLYLGNSGTTMRLMPGILSGQAFECVLTGDASLTRRPMKRIIDPLISMGVDISSVNGDGKPPLRIRGGGVKGINYTTKVASAQVKSCILLAGLYADGVTSVEEPLKSRDHTERMLKLFGADINTDGLKVTLNSGSKPLTAPKKNIFIPGDISSAAFFIALGLILEGSEIILRSVGINPTRRGIIDCLLRMGADIKIEGEKFAFEPFCDLRVRGGRLKATKVTAEEIPFLIDEIPVLTVCAALADGTTEIQGVGELRVKETDRVQSMISNLKKLGVDIWAEGDTLFIKGKPGRFDGAGQEFESFADHRTAMSMVVATCAASGECLIKDVDCIKTSFPDFFELLERIRSRA